MKALLATGIFFAMFIFFEWLHSADDELDF